MRSPGSLGGETPDFFTWVGRAAHGGHAVRTLSREGDAATVTRRRTDVPQWYQGAGMNGSDLEKNRDLCFATKPHFVLGGYFHDQFRYSAEPESFSRVSFDAVRNFASEVVVNLTTV